MDPDDARTLLSWLLARHGERAAALEALREGEALSPRDLLRAVVGLQEQAEIDLGSLLLYLLEVSGTQQARVEDAPDPDR